MIGVIGVSVIAGACLLGLRAGYKWRRLTPPTSAAECDGYLVARGAPPENPVSERWPTGCTALEIRAPFAGGAVCAVWTCEGRR